MKGKFITFEGVDGVGKTTQVQLLKETLIQQGKPCLVTREPGGTPGAEEIRKLLKKSVEYEWDPITELLLLTAARRDHMTKAILPALSEGKWVLCDRFTDSSIAYQGYLLEVDAQIVHLLCQFGSYNLQPDLTFILDVSSEISYERLTQRAHDLAMHTPDKYHDIQLSHRVKLREAYREIAHHDPKRCCMIDASESPQRTHEKILEILKMTFLYDEGRKERAVSGVG